MNMRNYWYESAMFAEKNLNTAIAQSKATTGNRRKFWIQSALHWEQSMIRNINRYVEAKG